MKKTAGEGTSLPRIGPAKNQCLWGGRLELAPPALNPTIPFFFLNLDDFFSFSILKKHFAFFHLYTSSCFFPLAIPAQHPLRKLNQRHFFARAMYYSKKDFRAQGDSGPIFSCRWIAELNAPDSVRLLLQWGVGDG